MHVAWSAPQGSHCHVDTIFLLPKLGIKKGQHCETVSAIPCHAEALVSERERETTISFYAITYCSPFSFIYLPYFRPA